MATNFLILQTKTWISLGDGDTFDDTANLATFITGMTPYGKQHPQEMTIVCGHRRRYDERVACFD